ncbi:MAG: CatA-like O-acetyltransferase [Bacteroidales bacterium]
MRSKIDVDTWNRKELFNFFLNFAEPFYGITVEIDVTKLYLECKANNYSFFVYSLHRILQAVNGCEPFRLRIEDGELYLYDAIHVSPSIGKENGTFAFSFMHYHPDLTVFRSEMESEIEKVRTVEGMNYTPDAARQDTIHFSAIPWVKFTSLSHARYLKNEDSVPKISTGKITRSADKYLMPLSVHVHHSLVDGKDVGMFIDLLQTIMDE